MNYPFKILFQSIVKKFFKENTGFFVFVFAMMFFIVSMVDGAGLYEYHYSLVTGMLKSSIFLSGVFFTWLMYVRKCVGFVSTVIQRPHYLFLQVYNQLSRARRFRLFLMVEILLLMPVLMYVLFICFVGFKQHFYLPVLITIGYLLLLCILGAAWHVCLLDNLQKRRFFALKKITLKVKFAFSYPGTLIWFVISKQPMILAGIKVFTCGTLYLIARNYSFTDADVSMAFLFYNFGILANGVLIFRIRAFEETYLNFYRGLPVSLVKRFLQYSVIYALFLIPEIFTAFIFLTEHLLFIKAVNFILCGFCLLLLMNSITFIEDFKMKDYVKILLAVFCGEYLLLMTAGFVFLYLLLFVFSIIIYVKRYYKFERNI